MPHAAVINIWSLEVCFPRNLLLTNTRFKSAGKGAKLKKSRRESEKEGALGGDSRELIDEWLLSRNTYCSMIRKIVELCMRHSL